MKWKFGKSYQLFYFRVREYESSLITIYRPGAWTKIRRNNHLQAGAWTKISAQGGVDGQKMRGLGK